MSAAPAEVVFSLLTDSDQTDGHQAVLFRYADGPVKVPGPWKRGRPRGSTKKGATHHSSIENEPAPSQFEFVNVTQLSKDIDEKSRAIIRKHAKLHRPRQKGHRHESATSHHRIEGQEVAETEQQSLGIMFKPNLPQIPGVDPFDRSPIKMEPYMHDLLLYYANTTWKHFYSLENVAGCNPVAEYWIPLAFQDSALLHSLIGCADAYISGYRSINEGLRGLKHLQAAISIVNERIRAGKDIMSSGTLTVIAGIAMLENGAGRHHNWQIHMQGLRRLVDICGGMESLYSAPMILNKILRADLYGSLDAVQLPYFNNPYPFLSELSFESSFHSEGFNAIRSVISLDGTICTCIHQLEHAMLFWSDAEGSLPNDDDTAQKKRPTLAEAASARQLLTNIQYTLVSTNFQQKFCDDTQRSQISEFCRITLILYSMTILNERPPSTSVGQQIGGIFRRVLTDLAGQSHDTTGDDSTPISWLSLPLPVDFYLWAIFLAASVMMTTAESDTKGWLLASFAQLASPDHGDVQDWNDLRSRLSRYLWVPSFHDPSAKWLWSETAEVMGKSIHEL